MYRANGASPQPVEACLQPGQGGGCIQLGHPDDRDAHLRLPVGGRGRAGRRQPGAVTWYAQIAEDSDVIDDPAVAGPDDRQRVPIGRILIDQVGPNSPEADRSLAFMRGSLPPGIEIADPMLAIRNASYPNSFQERNS